MSIWEQFSTDPAQNNKAAPYGAPEGQVQINLFTDICRVMMAAIREVADIAITTGGVIGTMGIQNKEAVQITGGSIGNATITGGALNNATIGNSTISGSNTIDGTAIKSGLIPLARIPLQALYNVMYPVGTQRIYLHSSSQDLFWGSSISAQWTYFAAASGYVMVFGGGAGGVAVQAGGGSIRMGANIDSSAAAGFGGTIGTGLSGAGIDHYHVVSSEFLRYGVGIATRVA
jgi:hypothetical protein